MGIVTICWVDSFSCVAGKSVGLGDGEGNYSLILLAKHQAEKLQSEKLHSFLGLCGFPTVVPS